MGVVPTSTGYQPVERGDPTSDVLDEAAEGMRESHFAGARRQSVASRRLRNSRPPTALHPARRPLRLALQRVAGIGHPHLPRHRRAALLHDVRELVGQQLTA